MSAVVFGSCSWFWTAELRDAFPHLVAQATWRLLESRTSLRSIGTFAPLFVPIEWVQRAWQWPLFRNQREIEDGHWTRKDAMRTEREFCNIGHIPCISVNSERRGAWPYNLLEVRILAGCMWQTVSPEHRTGIIRTAERFLGGIGSGSLAWFDVPFDLSQMTFVRRFCSGSFLWCSPERWSKTV